MERYVKSKGLKEGNGPGMRKKYEVYKILHKNGDIEGIWIFVTNGMII